MRFKKSLEGQIEIFRDLASRRVLESLLKLSIKLPRKTGEIYFFNLEAIKEHVDHRYDTKEYGSISLKDVENLLKSYVEKGIVEKAKICTLNWVTRERFNLSLGNRTGYRVVQERRKEVEEIIRESIDFSI